MSRIKLWVRNFSLTKQLFFGIFLLAILFTLMTVFYLGNGINNIILTEAKANVRDEQTRFLFIRENNVTDGYIENYGDKYGHFIYNTKDKVVVENYIKNDEVNNDIIIQINNRKQEDSFYYFKDDHMYLVNLISENNYFVSFTYGYRRFINSLNDLIFTFSIIIIIFIFLILMGWVSNIVKPLNKILIYLKQSNDGNYDENFTIARNDEIGKVALSIKELQQKLLFQDDIKQEMIQNISHDLKTPIAIIKSYSESINDGIYPYETLEKSVDIIIENANRLETKVYNLMLLNRIGYLYSDNDVVSLTDMDLLINNVANSLKMFRPGIIIIRDLDEVKFKGEEETWRLVLENLLENGLRYANTKVEVTLKKEMLTVYNDGEHIDEDLINRIFDPYQKGATGNFGLGLSIVNKICDTYGYTISVENKKKGVCFSVKEKPNESSKIIIK